MIDPGSTDPTKTQPRGLVRAVPGPSRETKLEQLRVRRVTGLRPYAAVLSILLGLAPIAGEFWLYYTTAHALNAWAILIGGGFIVTGAYMLNHQDTKDLTSFLVSNGIAIVTAIPGGIVNAWRGGRRATDPPVVITAPPAAAPPAAPTTKQDPEEPG